MTTRLSARRVGRGSAALDHGMDDHGGPRRPHGFPSRSQTPDHRYTLRGSGPRGHHAVHAPHMRELKFTTAEHCPRDAPPSLGAIAGYTGHIPGKLVENVTGGTWMKSNELATTKRNFTKAWGNVPKDAHVKNEHMRDRSTPTGPGKKTSMHDSWRLQQFGEHLGSTYSHTVRVPDGKTHDLDLKGANVPGYQGFIPGKLAENVYGSPFARTNRISQDRRLLPAYTPENAGFGSLSQTAPAAWMPSSDYPSIRNSMRDFRRNELRADLMPTLTVPERDAAQVGRLHETMGFRHKSAPSLHGEASWSKGRRRTAYEHEISYMPPQKDSRRVGPVEWAAKLGPAGEPSHTIKMDQLRHKLEFLIRGGDRT